MFFFSKFYSFFLLFLFYFSLCFFLSFNSLPFFFSFFYFSLVIFSFHMPSQQTFGHSFTLPILIQDATSDKAYNIYQLSIFKCQMKDGSTYWHDWHVVACNDKVFESIVTRKGGFKVHPLCIQDISYCTYKCMYSLIFSCFLFFL